MTVFSQSKIQLGGRNALGNPSGLPRGGFPRAEPDELTSVPGRCTGREPRPQKGYKPGEWSYLSPAPTRGKKKFKKKKLLINVICQYASAPRRCGAGADPLPGTSFAISLTLASPCIPGLALSHGQTPPGARLCPGYPHPARGQAGLGASCGQGAASREALRDIPASPRGSDKPERGNSLKS